MKKLYMITFVAVSILVTGCKKDWMSEKRNLSLIIPSSLQDMRRLLNESYVFRNDYRVLASLAADEYFLNNEKYNSIYFPFVKESYVWKDFVYGNLATDFFWVNPYKQVFYSNIVLEGLEKISPRMDELEEYNDIKGAALFFRARAFYTLAVQFAEPNVNWENGEALGIPLRLKSDISAPVFRNSLKETYGLITDDLKKAIYLLRRDVSNVKIIVSKPAAMGLLARCYLSMAEYESAFAYADSSLRIYDRLIDFNTLDFDNRFTFTLYNEEVIHDAPLEPVIDESTSPEGVVDRLLYDQYEEEDLRKYAFFTRKSNDEYAFKGSYHGDWGNWGGISTNEMFLIRAESAVRLGKVNIALSDMNTLLSKRYRKDSFVPLIMSDSEHLINVILLERRKELLFRGLRWEDLRRLNKEQGREQILTRKVNGEVYTLMPNDSRYVFKIPEQVIRETDIQQNN